MSRLSLPLKSMNTVPEVKVTAAAALAIIAEKFLPEGNREKVSEIGVAVNKIIALQRERRVAFWDRMPRKLPEYKYPKGVLLRWVNNSGDISWHKTRIFISEVFRFEELAFELVTPDFYKVFFRDMEIGELNAEELRFRAARRVV